MSQNHLDDLAKNNDEPSDSIIFKAKTLLLAPIKQLEDINTEIKRFEEKRIEVEKSIHRYSCILTPIRRVPPDILCIIFEHCLPTDRNPFMAATEAPILLTRICSSWRKLAMTSPRLWAQLHIPFRKEIEGHGSWSGEPAIPLEKVIDVLRLRCHAAEEWLCRSSNCPLSISISWNHADLRERQRLQSNTDRKDETTILHLKTLLLFSPIWKNLDLHIPMSVYSKLETMLPAHTFPMLAHLTTVVHDDVSSLRVRLSQLPPLPVELLKTPSLKRVSIVSDFFKAASQNLLTHLSLTCKFRIGLRPGAKNPDPFDLEALIVDHDLQTTPRKSQLLPHLEVFELHKTKVSDDLVLRFVTSRMNTMSHIAVLKKVHIHPTQRARWH